MATPDKRAVNKAEMIDYLNTSSDFAFELSILNNLVSLGLQCAQPIL